MILSVSRRTDIPACYPQWFMQRLREGYVMVRNPMNPHQVSRIELSPDTVDCIVFWTKNPAPIMPYLRQITDMGYPCLFHVTLNAYGRDVETALPGVDERISTVQKLKEMLGDGHVIWRYDPILLSDVYSVEWHVREFERIAQALSGSTQRCVISFLDVYGKIRKRLREGGLRPCQEDEMYRIAVGLAGVAAQFGIRLQTCAEKVDLEGCGIGHGACIDAEMISRIVGRPLNVRKDANQRAECGCVSSIDVGEYNTCRNGCVYCYANHSPEMVARRSEQHLPDSPLLVGNVFPDDRVTERRVCSECCESEQLTLF